MVLITHHSLPHALPLLFVTEGRYKLKKIVGQQVSLS